MSGLKRKATKRILAFTLSLAMAMSNMTVMASELTPKEDSESIVSEVSLLEDYNENGDEAELTDDAGTTGDEESTDEADTVDDEKSTDEADTVDDEESADDADTVDDADEDTESDEEAEEEAVDDELTDSSDSETLEDSKKTVTTKSKIAVLADDTKYDVTVETEGLDAGDKSKVSLEFTLAADHVLDVGEDLVVGTAWTTSEAIGTDKYFTVMPGPSSSSSNVNVNSNKKEFEDGYVGTARITTNGTSKTTERVLKFTTTESVALKVWWAPAGANRPLSIYDSDSGTSVETSGTPAPAQNEATISEFKITDPGNYCLGGFSGSVYIYKIEVYNGDIPESESFGIDDSIELAEGTYNVGVKLTDGLSGKAEVSPNPLEVGEDKDNELTVKFSKQADVTGTLTWGGAESSDRVDPATDISNLSIKFTPEDSDVSTVTTKANSNGERYTASNLVIGKKYTAEVSGIKDYKLEDSANKEITVEEDNTLDFTFTANERYDVTVNPTGLSSDELKDVTFTFTDKDTPAYQYKFTGTEGIRLRAGTYTVALSAIEGYKTNNLGDLVVTASSATLNIEFVEKGEDDDEAKVYVLEASALTSFSSGKTDGEAQQAGTENFFTILWSSSSNVSSSSKEWADGYKSGQRINFASKASTSKDSIKFETTKSATVKVWWAAAGDGRRMTILNAAGNEVANSNEASTTNNTAYLSTLKLADPGIYYLGGDTGKNYIFKVEVTEGEVQRNRKAWDEVANPVIKDVKLNASNKNLIDVTVGMVIGDDGADKVTVSMLDAEGEEISSKESLVEGDEVTVSLQPSASGTYKFKATASRDEETDVKESEVYEGFDFILSLAAPVIITATSLGASAADASVGSVEVEWNAVTEATAYMVSVLDGDKVVVEDTEVVAPAEAATLSHIIEGLKIRDEEYTISVYAKRGDGVGENRSEASTIKVKVTADAKQKWAFSAYGASVSISGSTPKDGYEGDATEGKVRVWSTGNGGKIVPASCGDGLAFYYTEVPADMNFTLSATANVNTWTYSNGQEGFGLMATDRVGVNGDSETVWTNSYMAMVSKVEYYWNGESVSDSGDKYSMYLGVGSLARTGITKAGLDEMTAQKLTAPKGFNTSTYSLDTTAATDGRSAGSYNIVGNGTNMSAGGETIREYTQFRLIIQKNNTGYFVSYVDPVTDREVVKKYYDTNALNKLDDTVYVGFFAARNADVTFDNISFTTIAPEDDAPAEEQPISYVTPAYQVISSDISNAEDYELVFTSNWDGELVIRDDMGNRVTEYVDRYGNPITDKDGNLLPEYKSADGSLVLETDENKTSYAYPVDIVNGTVKVTGTLDPKTAADKIDTKIRAKVKLNIGANDFKVTFKPDEDFHPDEFTKLSSYDSKTFTHTVSYRKYGEAGKALYVSPTGTSSGNGTKESPLDIYTAVKYVQAGQTIILADGTYKLTKTVTVDRGINGTADAMIYMIAEHPSTDMYTSNVVFDFGGRCAGMILAGDYWYFSGFDVTNTGDGDKGIQLSGSHCVLDQLKTYKNGNTGVQLSRYKGTDMTQAEWPSDNKIINCTSYLNSDSGYEDADGFAAKLTIGPDNVFDGCIAFYNADDGWDLFAKAENGPIGMVTIQNCVTFKNGYVLKDADGKLSLDGTEVDAGNGNGFKMGGESITGYHTLRNSISFFNKAKGIDSNSCPDIQVYNSISFNNESYNVAFYTNNAADTDFLGQGIISYRIVSGSDDKLNVKEQLSPKGDQDESKYVNDTSYFWDEVSLTSKNKSGATVERDWFEFITTDIKEVKIERNANGTINTNGFLVLSDKAGVSGGGLGEGTASEDVNDKREGEITDGTVDKGDNDNSGGSSTEHPEDLFDDNYKDEDLWTITVEPQIYTGSALKPEVRVYRGEKELAQGKDYSIKFKNNINASVKKNADGEYEPIYEDVSKLPTITVTGKGSYEGSITRTFEIRPVDISKETGLVAASDITIIAAQANNTQNIKPTVTFNGKKLTQNKDYTADLAEKQSESAEKTALKDFGHWNIELTGTGNFEGTNVITMHILNKNDKNNVIISNAKASIPTEYKNAIYTGEAWEPEIESIKVGSETYSFKAGENGKAAADSPYTLEYYNNVNAGTASVVIVGNGLVDGKYYTGTKTLTFKIKSGKLDTRNFTVYSNMFDTNEEIDSIANREIQYEGQAITFPRLAVTNDAIKAENKNLKLGEDYTVTYKNNKKAGKASVVIKGINNYSGSITKTFKIAAYDIQQDKEGWVGGSYKEYKEYKENPDTPFVVNYTKSGAKLSISLLINGKQQVLGTDYTVTYSNNKKISTDTSKAKAVIKGKGALKGTLTVPYSITAMDISDPEANVTVKVNDVAYAANKRTGDKYQSKVTLYDNGKTIPASAYDKVTYRIVETNKALDKDTELPFTSINDFRDSGYTVEAVIQMKETNNATYKGTITAEYRIAKWNIANAKISTIDPKYYGYETKIYSSDLNTIGYNEDDEEIVSESKVTYKPTGQDLQLLRCDKLKGDFYIDDTTFVNTGKVGTAKVTIRGVGKYSGSKVISYKINKMSWDVKKAVLNQGASISEADIIYDENDVIVSVRSNVFEKQIKLNGVYLKYGEDFELSTDPRYAPKRKNGVNVTITDAEGNRIRDKQDQLTVTIVGKDSYGGINSKITFAIE